MERDSLKKLHEQGKSNYKPIYGSKWYLEFINDNECRFSINPEDLPNFKHYFTMFSIVSQHVLGNTVEECLDKAINISLSED